MRVRQASPLAQLRAVERFAYYFKRSSDTTSRNLRLETPTTLERGSLCCTSLPRTGAPSAPRASGEGNTTETRSHALGVTMGLASSLFPERRPPQESLADVHPRDRRAG